MYYDDESSEQIEEAILDKMLFYSEPNKYRDCMLEKFADPDYPFAEKLAEMNIRIMQFVISDEVSPQELTNWIKENMYDYCYKVMERCLDDKYDTYLEELNTTSCDENNKE